MTNDVQKLLQSAYHDLTHAQQQRHAAVSFAERLFQRITGMASNHDEVLDLFTECETLVDRLISGKASSDAANADLVTKGTALRDKLKAALADDANAGTAVTVTSSVPTGSTQLPVQTTAPVASGSTVSGDAVASGTTVVSSAPGSITLSQPTTDAHAAGDTVTVTAPASAS